jgi:hypothetical protein
MFSKRREMVFRQVKAVVRRAKNLAGNAYSTALELAPGIAKGAEAVKRGYRAAADSGLIHELAGRHAANIHRRALRTMAAYDKFEDAARKGDGVVRAMRGQSKWSRRNESHPAQQPLPLRRRADRPDFPAALLVQLPRRRSLLRQRVLVPRRVVQRQSRPLR